MPPVAYDLEDNPIYKALKKKAKQIKGAADDMLRCVVLVDAGCDLLRRLRSIGAVHEIGGESIIRYAQSKLGIDSVIVLSQWRQRDFGFAPHSALLWKVSCFDRRQSIPDGEYGRWETLATRLPKPQFEGYQARDIHRQGGFSPNGRRWHLGTHVTTRGGGTMTIKLSAALLHEYLVAGLTRTSSGHEHSATARTFSIWISRAVMLSRTLGLKPEASMKMTITSSSIWTSIGRGWLRTRRRLHERTKRLEANDRTSVKNWGQRHCCPTARKEIGSIQRFGQYDGIAKRRCISEENPAVEPEGDTHLFQTYDADKSKDRMEKQNVHFS
jgi:hypothetical protein